MPAGLIRLRSAFTLSVLLGTLILISAPMMSPPAAAEEAAPVQPSAPTAPAGTRPAAGTDITQRSQEAVVLLQELREEVNDLGGMEGDAQRLAELGVKVEQLLPEDQALEDLLDAPGGVDGMLLRTRALSAELASRIDRLTGRAEDLEGLLARVRQLVNSWRRVQAEAADLPEALRERVEDILDGAAAIEAEINGRLNRVVELQNQSMAVRSLITPIEESIESYDRTRQTRLLERNAAPIWAITSEHISQSSERSSRRFGSELRRDYAAWTESSERSIGGHILLLPVVLLLLFKLHRAAPTKPSGALARPMATGILLWMLIGVVIYAGAPISVRSLYALTAMLVTAVVLFNYLPGNIRGGVIAYLVLAILEQALSSLPAAEHLPRLTHLVIIALLLAIAVTGLRPTARESLVSWGAPRPFVVAGLWAAIALLGLSLVANVSGYVQLGKLLLGGVIDSIAVFLFLFAALTSMSEIIEVVLGLRALDGIRSIAANRYRLNRVLRRPLVWLSLFLWAWATTHSFGVDEWLVGALADILLAEASIGEVTLSLRGILLFVLAVWLAVWASRIVRAVLNQDVLPRMELPRGVPNTISTTAHYAIMMIGLLLGTGLMGINLSSLAFIVGALGVGIGFGLQNLVNNFVSGLILIFEAPIQVGDTVEVGALMGRVVQIGIRASRVRTYSGSEVIVPNGDLVSNQVVNWTLSDRKRRLELRVGVAYGTDPARVTEVLRGVLEADEDVLEDPAPMIVFSEFADSSLNFRVFAWIADFDMGFTTMHRLNMAINAAFAEAGITIPFPQRDLHVKTPLVLNRD